VERASVRRRPQARSRPCRWLANQSDYGLTGTVWTSDIERGADLAGRVRAGVLAINSPAPMDLGAAFGGFKLSGIGRECGPEAIQDYTEYQSILVPRHRAT
jgi:aldehyde dehydrogenase (NAD+)